MNKGAKTFALWTVRYYLLASGGVNADQLSSTINAVNLTGTFEPLLPLSDTDVEVSSPSASKSSQTSLSSASTLIFAGLPPPYP